MPPPPMLVAPVELKVPQLGGLRGPASMGMTDQETWVYTVAFLRGLRGSDAEIFARSRPLRSLDYRE
jgi:hypothetical protein